MPKVFNIFPRSFSIVARALEKLSAALDNVLPLVQVFSEPYFLQSSDNLAPVQDIEVTLDAWYQVVRYQKKLLQVGVSIKLTYLDLLGTMHYITFNSTNNLPLKMLKKVERCLRLAFEAKNLLKAKDREKPWQSVLIYIVSQVFDDFEYLSHQMQHFLSLHICHQQTV